MALTQGYAALTGASGNAGDIPKSEARNGIVHLASLVLTKAGDGILDPKLVLTWTLNALGAPAAFVGALVPIREAGALLPQVLLAHRVQVARRRRLFWAAGSALQGLAVLAIAASAATLEGARAGWAILICLAVFSVARAVCSVSYKDVLARTIPKTRRGAITGAAGSVASTIVLGFAALLAVGIVPLSTATISAALAVAGVAWMVAGGLFTGLSERDAENDAEDAEISLTAPLAENSQFRRFITARALLVSTALAPPYLILASTTVGATALGALGPFMIASAGASILSAWIWGRLSDRSSRLTLAASATLATAVLGIAAAISLLTGSLFGTIGATVAIFVAQIAYEGVRSGRKLHLTDMAGDDERARFTAVSNTIIGLVLLLGGALGFLSQVAGPTSALALLAVFSALAIPVAYGLEEVQRD